MPFILASFFLVSCGSSYSTESKNEVWEIDIDSLYIKCSSLKGLGNLIIDETTFNQLKKDKYLTDKYIDSDFYFGFWGVHDHELSAYICENFKEIKQVILGSRAYVIGELKFKDIQCAFLNDTLVAISLNEDYYQIKDALIERYGNGKGQYSWYIKSKGKNGDNDFYLEKKEFEERIWENELVKFERYLNWNSLIVNNQEAKRPIDERHCYIISKKRFDIFLSVLNEAKESFRLEKENKIQQSYNAL